MKKQALTEHVAMEILDVEIVKPDKNLVRVRHLDGVYAREISVIETNDAGLLEMYAASKKR